MRLRNRIVATALTATLLVGAGSAAAVAGPTYSYSGTGFPSLSVCKQSESAYQAHFIRKGYRILGGQVCAWRGASLKYSYSFIYG